MGFVVDRTAMGFFPLLKFYLLSFQQYHTRPLITVANDGVVCVTCLKGDTQNVI
jgi:hypothetical protein